IIANTASNANTNVREFAEAFKMVGPIAKSADQSIKDVSASIGLLANSGIKGTMAGTALRTMMSKLIAPTGDAAKILKKFAIETIDQSTGNLRKLNDILIDMKAAGMGTADMFEIFDLRAAGAATVLKEASGIFDEFSEKRKIKFKRMASAMIPQGFIVSSNSRITLCGDAAGLTKPWSGGGVIWGLIAADILLKNFPNFLKYKKGIERFFLPRIKFSKLATKLVYFLGFNIPWLLPKNLKIESDFLFPSKAKN
ncbi:hypothetical protein LCGC14_2953270, partial [marine sediment metagenome]